MEISFLSLLKKDSFSFSSLGMERFSVAVFASSADLATSFTSYFTSILSVSNLVTRSSKPPSLPIIRSSLRESSALETLSCEKSITGRRDKESKNFMVPESELFDQITQV